MSQTSEALATLLPTSTQTDSESVASCLDTARALWAKGDSREAVRWLQRGAAAAEEAGDDERALAIARSAADLSAQLGPVSVRPPRPDSTAPESRRGGPEAVTPQTPSVRRTPPPVPNRGHSSAPPTSPSPSVAPLSQVPQSYAPLLASQNELIAQGRAVRVAVKRSAIDGALYVVRPLAGRPAAGAREALLILAEPDPAFFSNQSKG
jgi:hypothetical protein